MAGEVRAKRNGKSGCLTVGKTYKVYEDINFNYVICNHNTRHLIRPESGDFEDVEELGKIMVYE